MKAKYALAIAMAAILAGVSPPALAADAPGAPGVMAPFGVVDMNKVLQTTDAAKGIFSALEEKRKEFQAQIAKEEDSLRSAEAEVAKQKASLSHDDFEKKGKEFQQKMIDGQKMVQDKKRMLDQVFNDSMVKLRTEAVHIVDDVAKEKGYSAVLTQDAVMRSLPEMDMTEEVIKRLNAKVKKIPIDWSAAKEGAKKKAG